VNVEEINMPSVVAEVTECFRRYEDALVAGDVDVMGELFWSSPDVTRFGAADYQVGAEELAEFRQARGAVPPGRRLEDTRVMTFGTDLGVITTLVANPGSAPRGRQSQTWIRIGGSWRIVHAHVSRPSGG